MVNTLRKNTRVVMAGPLPPLIGGMATHIGDISKSSLSDSVQLELFNTGTSPSHHRYTLGIILSKLQLWRKWLAILRKDRNTIVHIHTCSGLSFFLDGILLVFARIHKCPSVLHIHGGRFDNFLDKLPSPALWLARRISKMATKVVVLSDEWYEKLSQRLPNKNYSVIANGVPIPEEIPHPFFRA